MDLGPAAEHDRILVVANDDAKLPFERDGPDMLDDRRYHLWSVRWNIQTKKHSMEPSMTFDGTANTRRLSSPFRFWFGRCLVKNGNVEMEAPCH